MHVMNFQNDDVHEGNTLVLTFTVGYGICIINCFYCFDQWNFFLNLYTFCEHNEDVNADFLWR